jgi:starvation-inducible DNA-binding protein
MHKTRNDLPEPTRKKMIKLLNARLADAIDLSTQAKQAHWNVKGPQFIGLHELFDKIHDALGEAVDEIAERAVQLGGTAMGTARVVAKSSAIKEYPHDIFACRDHVSALSDALARFGKSIRAATDAADKAGDADTADLFTGVSRTVDKYLWFVEAHAQEKT